MIVQLRLPLVTIKGKMLRIRKGAAALASTDSEGESARPTPSKKEKPTVSDCDEDDIQLTKPRMPEPRIPDVDDDIRKSGIPDVDDDTPLFRNSCC